VSHLITPSGYLSHSLMAFAPSPTSRTVPPASSRAAATSTEPSNRPSGRTRVGTRPSFGHSRRRDRVRRPLRTAPVLRFDVPPRAAGVLRLTLITRCSSAQRRAPVLCSKRRCGSRLSVHEDDHGDVLPVRAAVLASRSTAAFGGARKRHTRRSAFFPRTRARSAVAAKPIPSKVTVAGSGTGAGSPKS
jgi:hypothetical protein